MSIRLLLPNIPRVRALVDGAVRIPGIDLAVDASVKVVGDRFSKMLAGEYDGGEMCVLTYMRAREEGWPFIALPVFIIRGLKHRHIIVRKDSEIKSPRDLKGKTIGLTRYVTSPVWTRALIQHEYDVPLESVRWIAADPELYPISIPEFKAERLLRKRTALLDMVSSGEIEAAIFPGNDGYNCFYGGGHLDGEIGVYPNLKTVIDDPEVVIEYYRRTRIYPIIHMLVVKEQVLQENPGLAQGLTLAFDKARTLADNYVDEEGKRRAAEERRIIGRDPYECKLTEQDTKTMDTFLDYAVEQKLLRRKPSVRSLFSPESLESGL